MGDKIITKYVYMDGDVIEFSLRDGALSDDGLAYEAVHMQTYEWDESKTWRKQQAQDLCSLVPDVSYEKGDFIIRGVTEANLEESIARLVNVILLYYGLCMGAYHWSIERRD